jgi:hypothetical protein
MGFLGGSLAFLLGIVDKFEGDSDETSVNELPVENEEPDDDEGIEASVSGSVSGCVSGSVSRLSIEFKDILDGFDGPCDDPRHLELHKLLEFGGPLCNKVSEPLCEPFVKELDFVCIRGIGLVEALDTLAHQPTIDPSVSSSP